MAGRVLVAAAFASIAFSPIALAERVIISDVRLIDGVGGPPLDHVDVGVQDGLIATVGPHIHAIKHGAAGERAIDGHGLTLLPGLISDHSHLGLVDGTRAGAGNVTQSNILRQLRQYEAYGVTTVTSLGLNLPIFYELQPQLHSGALPGADIFGADRGFGVAGGAPPAGMGIADDQVYRPSSEDEARAQVRESVARHPSLLKIWVDDMHGTVPTKMSPAISRAIIDEAHKNGVRVAAHVFYLADAKQLVAEGVDVLAHGVRDVSIDAEFIAAMRARNVWYIPTLDLDESFYIFAVHPEWLQRPVLEHALQSELRDELTSPAWRSKVLDDVKKLHTDQAAARMNALNLKAAFDAGLKIGFGTDSGATPLRIAGFAEHRELQLLVQAGLTPLQAITVATSNAAQLLQLDDRGVIAVGKRADFVLVRGDPSRDITALDNIEQVRRSGAMAAGKLSDFEP